MSTALLKKLGVLAAVLVLIWGVYLYRQVPHNQTPFARAAEKAEEVILEQGANKVDLRKQAGHWTAVSGAAPAFAADEGQITQLILSLKGVQIEDEISDRADKAADYEVTLASGTLVRLSGAKGAQSAEGIFGKQAPDFNHIYFRFPDKRNVYLARGVIRGELGTATANFWRSHQLIDFPDAKIQGILIEGHGFRTDLVRASMDVWTMGGKPVDPAPVNTLVGTLAHLRADDFLDPAAGSPMTFEGLTFAHLLIKGEGASAEIRMGAQDAKTKRYPVSMGKDSGIAWISENTANALLQKPTSFKAR